MQWISAWAPGTSHLGSFPECCLLAATPRDSGVIGPGCSLGLEMWQHWAFILRGQFEASVWMNAPAASPPSSRSRTAVLKLEHTPDCPRGRLQTQTAGPDPRVCNSAGSVMGPEKPHFPQVAR